MNEIMNKLKELKLFRDSDQLKKVAILVLLILIIGVGFAAKNGMAAERELDGNIPEEVESEIEETSSQTIFVDIGGAVKEPMLAELPSGSRVEDAIIAAGGLTDKADISSINRAEFLEDGEKIYIPEKAEGTDDGSAGIASGESVDSSSGNANAFPGSNNATSKININIADSTQLQEITGVGPATAQKIIDYRTSNGRFKSIEDIKNVSGIGDKTFEKMKDQITV